MNSRILIWFCTLLFVVSCHTKKKGTTINKSEVTAIKLDTLRVYADENKREVYQESNPRLSDILHTRLDVSFDWNNSRLNGTATIDLKQHFYPSRSLFLNARGMDIKKVEVYELTSAVELKKTGNKTAEETVSKATLVSGSSYVYENDSIKIDLGKVFSSKENYRVVIEYVAKPDELKEGGSRAISSDKGLYFINPKGENPFKMPQVWTQGETQSNSVWFPTIDSPNEKVTQEIFMTVNDKYTTLSNGALVDSKENGDGTRTDHWKMDLPHAPYLAMMAVGQFKKVTDQPWNGKEVSYYVEKEYEPHAKGIFGDTKEMIECFSTRLGVPYAWPKYAQIVCRDYVSGAMENTSATLHGEMVAYQTTRELLDGNKAEDVISHELFHQWFGDLVTCESWSNLPLNESFATYGEYLWQEYKHGREAADHHHSGSRQAYMASTKEVDLIRFNYEDREDMFDGFSYSKGGQVLHMLRKAVGDDAFFASLKNYLETNKFKTGEIHQLRLAFEEVTGKDMNWFFNEWFLNKGRPKIKVTNNFNSTTNEVELTIEQEQDLKNVPLYKLPVDIDVYVNGSAKRSRIWITDKKQTFKIKSEGTPQLVNFDAERQLLCDLDYTKKQEEYLFQYKNAPLYEDRLEALKKTEANLADATVFEMFKNAAQNDKYHAIRNYAIQKLEKAPADKIQDVKATLISVYNNDKKTTTREKALSAINKKFGGDADVLALNEKALSEMSYAINGETLDFFTAKDGPVALEKAKQFEGESGKAVLFPVTEIYAKYGADAQIPFFQSVIKYFNGFELITFCANYAKTAKHCIKPETALMAATDLEGLSKGATRFVKYACVKGIKDIQAVWEDKERGTKSKIETAKKENKDTASMEAELKTITDTKNTLQEMYKRVK